MKGRTKNNSYLDLGHGVVMLTVKSKTHGTHFALIDADMLERVQAHSWRIKPRNRCVYFRTSIWQKSGKTVDIFLHQLIIGKEQGKIIDHIDPDKTYDNRRSNLRHTSQTINAQNRRGRMDASSQYKGVHKPKNEKKWRALIEIKGKQQHLGMFTSEVDAARAYNEAATRLNAEQGCHYLLNQLPAQPQAA